MFMVMSYNMHLNVERFRESHRTLSTLELFVLVVQKFLLQVQTTKIFWLSFVIFQWFG